MAKTATKQQDVSLTETKKPREIVEADRDFFREYAEESIFATSIVGSLLKFNKGEWLKGQDAEEVPLGTMLTASMNDLYRGWIKWAGGRPVQQIMGPVAEGFVAPQRNVLGDFDESLWEEDQNGAKRDPWQETTYCVMRTPGLNGLENVDLENFYTFSTTSIGGRKNATSKLALEYSKARISHDGYPIVKLGRDFYKHKVYGKIWIPLFELVGWEPVIPVGKAGIKMLTKPATAGRPAPTGKGR
jgi:hypothetical protein